MTLIVSLTACFKDLLFINGNGIIKTESHRTGLFYHLENSTSIDVIYKVADTSGITIKADENLLEYIETETYDNTLEIKCRPGYSNFNFTERPLITISSPRLDKAVILGSGAFFADEMSGDEVTLKLTGSGDISAQKVLCRDFTVKITGSGNINISDLETESSDVFLTGSGNFTSRGRCTTGTLKITGSGEIKAENFDVGSASVIISGSGNAYTSIKDNLNAMISGSGNIYLKGDPEIIKTISGSGRIILYN